MAEEYEDDAAELIALAKKVKLPRSLAAVADMMYTAKQERYALAKQLREKKAIEMACQAHLILELPKKDATGIKGKLAAASITEKLIPTATDWDKIQKFVLSRPKDGFSFLQRRLNTRAVEEIWALGKRVPGVDKMIVKKISLNKAK